MRYPDEPLRRNYSRLLPDSLSNYRYYIDIDITTMSYSYHYLKKKNLNGKTMFGFDSLFNGM